MCYKIAPGKPSVGYGPLGEDFSNPLREIGPEARGAACSLRWKREVVRAGRTWRPDAIEDPDATRGRHRGLMCDAPVRRAICTAFCPTRYADVSFLDGHFL